MIEKRGHVAPAELDAFVAEALLDQFVAVLDVVEDSPSQAKEAGIEPEAGIGHRAEGGHHAIVVAMQGMETLRRGHGHEARQRALAAELGEVGGDARPVRFLAGEGRGGRG